MKGEPRRGLFFSKRCLQARYHFCRRVCFDTRAIGQVKEAVGGPLGQSWRCVNPNLQRLQNCGRKEPPTTPHCVGCSRVVQAPDFQVTDAFPGSRNLPVRCTLPNQELQIEASYGSTPGWLRRHGGSRKPYLTLKLFPPPCFLRRSKEAFPPSRGWCLGCPDLLLLQEIDITATQHIKLLARQIRHLHSTGAFPTSCLIPLHVCSQLHSAQPRAGLLGCSVHHSFFVHCHCCLPDKTIRMAVFPFFAILDEPSRDITTP
ncbi:hypothetical protein CKAH01_03626 [Colletotrichum kahawae]|uniref:Uncharacterized protein n=1 Tax=Colletotrichum kahawae TaxID=34407 RepID=A0AAD9YQM7_COLKA|nr:hypothetical protein CKAH01_03626 [Colletotrichum kahawae]